MRVICLIGNDEELNEKIENKLLDVGFKRSPSYTTREINTDGHADEVDGVSHIFVNKDQFDSLVNQGIIINKDEVNGYLYGTPRVFGASNYVARVGLNGFKALKNLYKSQIYCVLLVNSNRQSKEAIDKQVNDMLVYGSNLKVVDCAFGLDSAIYDIINRVINNIQR